MGFLRSTDHPPLPPLFPPSFQTRYRRSPAVRLFSSLHLASVLAFSGYGSGRVGPVDLVDLFGLRTDGVHCANVLAIAYPKVGVELCFSLLCTDFRPLRSTRSITI